MDKYLSHFFGGCIYVKMMVDMSIFLNLMAEEHTFKSRVVPYVREHGESETFVKNSQF